MSGGGRDSNSAEMEEDPPAPMWSKLPSDLIEMLSKKLTTIDDYVRFRAVCLSWRSATPAGPRHLPPQLPWLIFSCGAEDGGGDSCIHSSRLSGEEEIHRLELPGMWCGGSSHGWLLTIEEKSPAVSLINPVTRAVIQLPPLTTFPDVVAFQPSEVGGEYVVRSRRTRRKKTYRMRSERMCRHYIRKVILSSDPALKPDAMVMVILFNSFKLAFCRVGSNSWTIMDVPKPLGVVEDVACYRGNFYAIFSCGTVAVCDVGPPAKIKPISLTVGDNCDVSAVDYLVESASGDLLLVSQYESSELEQTPFFLFAKSFKVFKLELGDRPKCFELKSMGDSMLFLGPNHSIGLSASGFSGWKGNCIYYTDFYHVESIYKCGDNSEDKGSRCHDIRMFSLEDGKTKLLCCYEYELSFEWQPPYWVTPNLCQ